MIYIVDDDPIQNMLVAQLLKTVNDNVKYKEFANGAEVIEAINSGEKPEVILLDINMPIMNGWEFLEEYKTHQQLADVFIVSSSSDAYDLNKSVEYPCIKGYFNKPISVDSILEILNLPTQ